MKRHFKTVVSLLMIFLMLVYSASSVLGVNESVNKTNDSDIDSITDSIDGANDIIGDFENEDVSNDDLIENKTDFASGNGSEDNPYVIESAEDFEKIKDYLDSYFVLGNDIDFKDNSFEPIGDKDAPFSGGFDGNGKIISNLNINDSYDKAYVGLFGFVSKAKINNVRLVDCKIDIDEDETNIDGIGFIAGSVYKSSITSSFVVGQMNLNLDLEETSYIAPLVGKMENSEIDKSYTSVDITNNTTKQIYLSSIVANAIKSNISNVYATGDIEDNSESSYINAICSKAENSNFEYCYNVGEINSYSKNTALAFGEIDNCNFKSILMREGKYNLTLNLDDNNNQIETKSLKELENSDTYIGYDLENIWTIEGNKDYPYLELQGLEQYYYENDEELEKKEDKKQEEIEDKDDEEDYIEIDSVSDFNKIREDLSGKYILTKDIDFKNVEDFTPIGDEEHPFSGVLNGNGFCIKNLNISAEFDKNENYLAIFTKVSGKIKNLGVENSSISVKNFDKEEWNYSYIGFIAGVLTGKIERCYSNSAINVVLGNWYSIGGLVGKVQGGSVAESYFSGKIKCTQNVSSSSDIGGIAGGMAEGEIKDCFNLGIFDVKYNDSFIGGLVGYCVSEDGISTSINYSNIPKAKYSGALVGFKDVPIINSYYTNDSKANGCKADNLSDGMYIENINNTLAEFDFDNVWANENERAVLKNVKYVEFEDNAIKSKYLSGSGTKENPYKISNVSDFENISKDTDACYELTNDIDFKMGKLSPIELFNGSLEGNGHTIKNAICTDYKNKYTDEIYSGLFAFNCGDITNLNLENISFERKGYGDSWCIGVLCSKNYGNVSKISIDSDIKINYDKPIYFGFISGGNFGKIESCENRGDTNITNKDILNVGGISGYSESLSIINKCMNLGNIKINGVEKTDQYSAGITGSLSDGSIKNCFNAGKITASGDVYTAGIVGFMETTKSVKNSYNVGKISSCLRGAIAGYYTLGRFKNVYYLEDEISPIVNSLSNHSIKSLDAKQMTDRSRFDGFDFNDIWTMRNNDYLAPQLKDIYVVDFKFNGEEVVDIREEVEDENIDSEFSNNGSFLMRIIRFIMNLG